MAASGGTAKRLPSLPPPRPKSPPEYPDLYGKRRELAKVQMLEREIRFLEEELKSVDGLQPASRCCKELADFVVANPDPLIPTNQKIRKSSRFWKWLCGGVSCLKIPRICCCGCCPRPKLPTCCNCHSCFSCPSCCSCPTCFSCSVPKCPSCSRPKCRCCNMFSCSRCCCIFQCPSCSDCSCSKPTCCCPKCPKVPRCSCCTENCCYRCCLCY